MGDDSVKALIERLSARATASSAWMEFLERYSPLIQRIVARYEPHPGEAPECRAFVSARLSDDDFRRLRGFRVDGPARFETWLMTVIANLCRDWRRNQRGRLRMPRPVSRLPELEQHVYHQIFVCGASRGECVASLAPLFPGLSESTVAAISAQLFRLLPPAQRWQAGARRLSPRVPVHGSWADNEDPTLKVPDPAPGPDELAERVQQQRQLRDALSCLPPQQRLLLRLRFEQGLTLAEVARLMRFGDPFRANRQVLAALDALKQLMDAGRTPK
jgi:RNA polymerase sigma factor (sigma-70 family)